ncbi:hypothetical protein ACHAWF_005529 [Thalassiosira exigua]
MATSNAIGVDGGNGGLSYDGTDPSRVAGHAAPESNDATFSAAGESNTFASISAVSNSMTFGSNLFAEDDSNSSSEEEGGNEDGSPAARPDPSPTPEAEAEPALDELLDGLDEPRDPIESLLLPEKKLSFLILLLTYASNRIKLSDREQKHDTPEKFCKDTHPFSEFVEKKGFRKKMLANKDLMVMEINHRCPNVRINVKNTKMERMMSTLAGSPVTDEHDLAFIASEEERFRSILEAQLSAEEEDPETGAGRLTDLDRLRFIILLCSDKIRVSYLRSQHAKDRIGIDYQNSEERELDWKDFICEDFKDSDVEACTESLPNLHDKFRRTINCPKGAYELTREKCAELIQDAKGKLRDIIRRYNLSGNGSDIATFDDDTDDEDEVLEEEATYGRFNAARALRRANRRGVETIKLADGDDRASFLKHNPYSILYWWHAMDKYNLLFFTMNRLSDDNSASCDKTPAAVSRKKRKGSSGGDGVSDFEASARKTTTAALQAEMSSNVGLIGSSMKTVAFSTLAAQREGLQQKKFDLEWKRLDIGDNARMKELIDRRIGELDSAIAQIDDKVQQSVSHWSEAN